MDGGETGSARARAQAAQGLASDPAVSAFVSASAGSGKTKLLTDRLLRLLLGGADAARIQCLTYTRAGAAEMAVRLHAVLGSWVTLPDAELDAALRALAVAPDAATRERARALFATVLDLPGGMRIGTIHAFCQSLLRRFPLEARLSPHFTLLADAQERGTRREAGEAVLGGVTPGGIGAPALREPRVLRPTLDMLAGAITLAQFDKLLATLLAERPLLDALLAQPLEKIVAAQRTALGTTRVEAEILRDAVAWPDETSLRGALREIVADGPPTRQADASARLDWLAGDDAARHDGWAGYADSYFTKGGEPCSWKTVVGEALGKQRPHLRAALEAEQARVAAIREALAADRCAVLSAALLALALPMAAQFAAQKQHATKLDYADLITRTHALLADPGAAWVLFKLDGGLDHLLLDEVQDTAPAQWAIAGALVAEFFAGLGARDRPRTVFAVGDRKQSIFSFQGAEPAMFDSWRTRLATAAAASGWHEGTLDVSFRSTAPVLALVDAVFAHPQAAAGVCADETLAHRVARAGQAGAVELWPLAPKPETEEPPAWAAPSEPLRARSAPQLLAETLADWIARETAGNTQLPSRDRPLAPGDVLVLVRRRNAFATALVRCLKQRGVPVAGLDRMRLTEQPAVADLLALCDALLLPEDDLAVACVLTSPLGGLDDDDLIALAPGRAGSLWDALHGRAAERPAWRDAAGFLAALFARVDFAAPHALLAEALGPLGGRARLLARLGPEAGDPIDELLAAALTYAATEPASLQGFVQWVRGTAAEVKREAHAAETTAGGGQVRIMTVHGAKGLQAPLVILPDTTALPRDEDRLVWAPTPGGSVPLWAPLAGLRSARLKALCEEAATRRAEEHNRLLYVALTRAEDRLLVCGWEHGRTTPEASWYERVKAGFATLAGPVTEAPLADWGVARRHGCAQAAAPDRAERHAAASAALPLPAWAGAAPLWRAASPPPEPALPQPLAPSRPEDAALGPVPASASPLTQGGTDARFRRGALLHGLLQHLPDLPPSERAAAAARYLARPAHGLNAAEQSAALADVLAVIEAPALAPLFGPGSRAEVPLTGVVAGALGGVVVGGLVDRLALLPGRVLVADYKTARLPPARAEDAPVLYLRQMAAYRAVLGAAFPGRAVDCLLVWTTGPLVMPLPAALLDSHAPGAQAD